MIYLLYIVAIILAGTCSMLQEYLEDEDIDKQNEILGNTRWMIVLCGMLCIALSTQTQFNIWISMIVSTYIFTLFGIQLPKRIANQKDHQKQVKAIYAILHPFLSVLAFPVRFATIIKEQVREEDIREMLNEGSDIDVPQKEMIENVFEMDDIDVEEICTHRSEVIMLSLDQQPSEWRETIHENRHTMYPICGEDEDDIIGVLDSRDYFRLSDDSSQDVIINKAMDEPFFVAENTKVDELFEQMTNRKNYFSIVVDEYGGMTGIVTLHDIMESLVGEIYEEDEEIEPLDIRRIDLNQWWIRGSAEISDVEEALEIELNDEDNETFNGYVLSQYGHIPEDGSQFELDLPQWIINVKEVKNHRIEQTIVQIKGE